MCDLEFWAFGFGIRALELLGFCFVRLSIGFSQDLYCIAASEASICDSRRAPAGTHKKQHNHPEANIPQAGTCKGQPSTLTRSLNS